MASKVGMANAALSKIGANRITALTDDSEPARLAKQRFDDILEDMLQATHWGCAIKRATLAPLADAPAHGYSYQFVLPSDCLQVIEEINDNEWEIEQGRLVCDSNAPQITYIARVTDMNKLSSMFREAFSLRLASELAVPLAGSGKMSDRLYAQYERKMASAMARDGQEQNIESEQEEGDWIDERFT